MKALTVSLVLATSLLGTNSYASDRFVGTVTGGAIGAIVGNYVGGTNGAIIGGVAGAYLGSAATHRELRREVFYVREPRPYRHHRPRRDAIVYEDSPRVYYSQPAYYAPAPVYVRDVRHGRGHHGRHHHYD